MSANMTQSIITRFSDEDLPSSTCRSGADLAEDRSQSVVSEVVEEIDQWAQSFSQTTNDITNQNVLSSSVSFCEVPEARPTRKHESPEEVVDPSVSCSGDDRLIGSNVCPIELRLDSVIFNKNSTDLSVHGDQKSESWNNVSVAALECATINVEDEPASFCARASDDTNSFFSHTYSSNHRDSITSSSSVGLPVDLPLQDAETIRLENDTLSDTSPKSPGHFVSLQIMDAMNPHDNVSQSESTASNSYVPVTTDPNESPVIEEVIKKNRKRRSKLKQNSQRAFDLHH
ncbi:hypothetical protein EG68_01173 [Paragonimus skrjabini miyazakii]|uniref:Uncharacterized protein n=1 Tax=Paragonimus skrjabini miyazakii TaxID=59628 RepID=A0A8S9ZC97_9TREM|nr:hypothetical protein EG68_01173 [Paragonimus skrjabini miyazakii]